MGRRGRRRVAQPHQLRHAQQRARAPAGSEHRGADPGLRDPAQREDRVVRRADRAARPDGHRRPIRLRRAGHRAPVHPPPPALTRRGPRGRAHVGRAPGARRSRRRGERRRGRRRGRAVGHLAAPGQGHGADHRFGTAALPVGAGEGVPLLTGRAGRDRRGPAQDSGEEGRAAHPGGRGARPAGQARRGGGRQRLGQAGRSGRPPAGRSASARAARPGSCCSASGSPR